MLLRDAQERAHPRRNRPEKAELRSEIFDSIEVFYNRSLRHRSLGFLSPEQFETITHHHQPEKLQTA